MKPIFLICLYFIIIFFCFFNGIYAQDFAYNSIENNWIDITNSEKQVFFTKQKNILSHSVDITGASNTCQDDGLGTSTIELKGIIKNSNNMTNYIYNWSVIPNTGTILSDLSGSVIGTGIDMNTLTNFSSTVAGTFVITFEVSDTTIGGTTETATYTITVDALPSIPTITTTNVCGNDNSTSLITINDLPTTDTYTITYDVDFDGDTTIFESSENTITGISSSSNTFLITPPLSVVSYTGTIRITGIENENTNCSFANLMIDDTFLVTGSPIIENVLVTDVCIGNSATVELEGRFPTIGDYKITYELNHNGVVSIETTTITSIGTGLQTIENAFSISENVLNTPTSSETFLTITGIKDNSTGCVINMGLPSKVLFIVEEQPTIAGVIVDDGCENDSFITVTINGLGNRNYDIVYNIDNLNSDTVLNLTSTNNTFTINNTSVGNHTINITEIRSTSIVGCVISNTSLASDIYTINTNPIPKIILSENSGIVDDGIICFGEMVSLSENNNFITYLWSSGENTSSITFNPTATDTYTVTVTDNNGCENTDVVPITVNPLPAIAASAVSSAVCDGEDISLQGIFNVNGSSTSSSNWDWSGPNNYTASVKDPTAFISNPLKEGSYTVTVMDNNGCENTDVVLITVNPLPAIAASASSSVVCDGEDISLQGIFNVNGSSISASNWDWSGPDNYTASVKDPTAFISNPLKEGSYTVTVMDNNGCENTDTVSITVNPLPTIAASASSSVVCNGEDISLQANFTSFGTSTSILNWNWSGPDNYTASVKDPIAFISNLSKEGSYTVIVTDNNGCENIDVVPITVNPLPAIVASAASSAVCDGEDISLQGIFNVTGSSTSASNWDWSGPDNYIASVKDPTAFISNPLKEGIYTVTVTDNNGCTDSAMIDIIVYLLPHAILSVADTSGVFDNDTIICVGESITFLAATGTGYNYTFFNDLNNNSVLDNGENIQDDTLFSLVSIGSINGGIGSIKNGDRIGLITTDTNGCVNTASTLLTKVNPLPILSTPDTLIICEEEDVFLQANFISFGASTSILNWNWEGPNNYATTSQNPSSFSATLNSEGLYEVKAIDNNQCENTDSLNILINLKPLGSINVSDNFICAGSKIELIFSATVGNGVYDIVVNNTLYNNINNGDTLKILEEGVDFMGDTLFALTTIIDSVTDCINLIPLSNQTIAVTFPAEGVLTATDSVICEGDIVELIFNSASSLGSFDIVVDGIQYHNIHSGVPFVSFTEGIDFTNNTTFVLDSILGLGGILSCVNKNPMNDLDIIVNDLPKAGTIVGNNNVCLEEEITLTGSASGGTEPYLYNWWFSETFISGTSTSNTIDIKGDTVGLADVFYNVTDANNCTSSIMAHLVEIQPLPVMDFINDITYCNEEWSNSVEFSSNLSGTSYTWTSDIDIGFGTNSIGDIPPFMAVNLTNNDVIAVISITPTVTTTGCVGKSKNFEMTVHPTPMITNYFAPKSVENQDDFEIELTPNTMERITFIWTVDSLDNILSAFTGETMEKIIIETLSLDEFLSNGKVYYSVKGKIDECVGDSTLIEVNVLRDYTNSSDSTFVSIPNTFTPNGDQINDTWRISLLKEGNIEDYTISIFNRSGTKIYEMQANQEWDGNGQGGKSVPDGAYIYMIENNYSAYKRYGMVTILRRTDSK